MSSLDTYTAGTIAVTNGSPTVTGSGTAWYDAATGAYAILGGMPIFIGGVAYFVKTVNSATSLTLWSNFAGSSASGLSYSVARYSFTQAPAILGIVKSVFDRLDGVTSFPRVTIESGAVKIVLRDDGSGNASIYAGNPGASDGSMLEAVEINKSTGVVNFPQIPLIGGASVIGRTNTVNTWAQGNIFSGYVNVLAASGDNAFIELRGNNTGLFTNSFTIAQYATGAGELNVRANQPLSFKTNDVVRMDISAAGVANFVSVPTIGSQSVDLRFVLSATPGGVGTITWSSSGASTADATFAGSSLTPSRSGTWRQHGAASGSAGLFVRTV